MARLTAELSRGYRAFGAAEGWAPPVNVYETERAYLVCVELAGVDYEKIEVVVAGGRLRLRGERGAPLSCRPEAAAERHVVHVMEIDQGAFVREVDLPDDVAADRIGATYHNGMLWIELPKRP